MPAEMLESAKLGVQVIVMPRQELRTKMFSTPLLVFPRLEASEENAMNWPERLMLGCSLRPFAGLGPLVPMVAAVDTRVIEGMQLTVVTVIPRQVSRT